MPENQTCGTLASIPSTKKKLSPFGMWVIACTLCPLAAVVAAGPMNGPLRIHPQNPRYFTDDSGKAIYLTGSHTWHNLQDSAKDGEGKEVYTLQVSAVTLQQEAYVRKVIDTLNDSDNVPYEL